MGEKEFKSDNLQELLSKLEKITHYIFNRQVEENRFNIFSVLHKESDERRLHSRFIAALLNPKGSHGLGIIPISFFIKEIGLNNCFSPEGDIVVIPNENHKGEEDNIDIQINNKTRKQIIIIENKIYAGDQPQQLFRYYEKKKNNDAISILYLTLDGHSPSDDSIRSDEVRKVLKLISYDDHIIKWLDKLLAFVDKNSFLYNSLVQYKKLLTKMTKNDTNIKERIEIRDIVGDKLENIDSFRLLLDTKKHLVWHTLADFWDELKTELENNQYFVTSPVKIEDITKVAHEKRGTQKQDILMSMCLKKDNLCLQIIQENNIPLYWKIDEEEKSFTNELHLDDIISFRDSCYLMNKQYRQEIVKSIIIDIMEKIGDYTP